ncbi:uncharacterized protein LOC144517441 [Sander vitreus]
MISGKEGDFPVLLCHHRLPQWPWCLEKFSCRLLMKCTLPQQPNAVPGRAAALTMSQRICSFVVLFATAPRLSISSLSIAQTAEATIHPHPSPADVYITIPLNPPPT